MNFSIEQLEYIVALDTFRHFKTAADHCSVTQPTLSMQVKKLEDYLGFKLFDRSKKPLIPTEAGTPIIEQARSSLHELKRIESLAADLKTEIQGHLTLGIIPTIAPYLAPLFIGNFLEEFPKVTLEIRELMTDQVVEQLQKDQLDAGIIVTPLDIPGIKHEVLYYEAFYAYLNKTHPALEAEQILLTQLENERLWLLTEGNCFRNQVVNLCGTAQKQKDSRFLYESGALHALTKLVDSEGGVTLLPELALADTTTPDQIRPIGPNTPYREVSISYTRSFTKERLLKLLINKIKKAVPASMLELNKGQIIQWQ